MQPFSFFFSWLFVGGGGGWGGISGRVRALNLTVALGSGQTISGTGRLQFWARADLYLLVRWSVVYRRCCPTGVPPRTLLGCRPSTEKPRTLPEKIPIINKEQFLFFTTWQQPFIQRKQSTEPFMSSSICGKRFWHNDHRCGERSSPGAWIATSAASPRLRGFPAPKWRTSGKIASS